MHRIAGENAHSGIRCEGLTAGPSGLSVAEPPRVPVERRALREYATLLTTPADVPGAYAEVG